MSLYKKRILRCAISVNVLLQKLHCEGANVPPPSSTTVTLVDPVTLVTPEALLGVPRDFSDPWGYESEKELFAGAPL